MNAFRIRRAVASDAPTLARLITALNVHEGKPGVRVSPGQLREHGFGASPVFTALLAVEPSRAIGYALLSDVYNTDLPAPGLWLSDLFVVESARGRGVGRALMSAAARLATERGAASLWWPVRRANHGARRFYARLGARDEEVRVMELDDTALQRLAVGTDHEVPA